MTRFLALLALGLLLPWVAPAAAQQRLGDPAPEFPPGPFTDGGQYKLSDFKGKLVVLYFFESDPRCKNCRTIIPERTAVVKAFQGKPVKFLGVAANVTLPQAVAFQNQTGLPMPIFADSLGLMQARNGFKISLQNIWQMRIIGPNGGLEADAMDKETIDRVLKKTEVQAKHDFAQYDNNLRPALELLEFGHYGPGIKALARFTKVSNKAQSEGAKKLIAEVKTEAMSWKVDADDAAGIEPLKAYDLYQKIAAALPADELGKSSAAAAKKLATDKSIAPELAARKSFAALTQTMGQVTAGGQSIILTECKNIMKKYPGTPTADKADDLYKELGGKEMKGKESGGKGVKKAG
jgi:peroxiredoxin